jgi:anaerobic ribonucleoside-triphosphate reductase activating protein
MKIALNNLQFPVTTLGFGRRVGVWTQGCGIGCPGCMSKDTWSVTAENYVDIEEVRRAFLHWPNADGVTISGGEPFQQPEALEKLLLLSRKHYTGDILVFSGFDFIELEKNFSNLISMVDVLVAGPFRPNTGTELALRGSDNQTVHLFTKLARDRYPSNLNELRKEQKTTLNIGITEKGFAITGIPGKGKFSELRMNMANKGYESSTSDQRKTLMVSD